MRSVPQSNRAQAQSRGRSAAAKGDSSTGFTLLELMIVITILFVLVGLAAGLYERSVVRSKEAVLKHDLQVMRQAIEQYTLDKQAAPQSLEDLQQAGYLREVPTDPITRAKDWQLKMEDIVLSPEQTTTGVTDVHSNSDRVSPFEGSPYNTW